VYSKNNSQKLLLSNDIPIGTLIDGKFKVLNNYDMSKDLKVTDVFENNIVPEIDKTSQKFQKEIDLKKLRKSVDATK
jgi:hypothetical protein